MKRLAIFALPMLATIFAVGLGLFLLRNRTSELGPRLGAAKATVAEAFDEMAHAVEEALE